MNRLSVIAASNAPDVLRTETNAYEEQARLVKATIQRIKQKTIYEKRGIDKDTFSDFVNGKAQIDIKDGLQVIDALGYKLAAVNARIVPAHKVMLPFKMGHTCISMLAASSDGDASLFVKRFESCMWDQGGYAETPDGEFIEIHDLRQRHSFDKKIALDDSAINALVERTYNELFKQYHKRKNEVISLTGISSARLENFMLNEGGISLTRFLYVLADCGHKVIDYKSRELTSKQCAVPYELIKLGYNVIQSLLEDTKADCEMVKPMIEHLRNEGVVYVMPDGKTHYLLKDRNGLIG